MQAETLPQQVRSARDWLSAYLDTTEGATRMRVALIAMAIVAYFRPDPHGLGLRILELLSNAFTHLGILVIYLLVVPGLLRVAVWICRFLRWVLPIIDAALFSFPRFILREKLRLGGAASFLLAMCLEVLIAVGAWRHTAAAFRTQPGAVVANGVYQPQKHGREPCKNLFPGGRAPGVSRTARAGGPRGRP